MTQMLGAEVDGLRVACPRVGSDPVIEGGREFSFLAVLPVVEHEAEAVALISGTLLGAVGDVASVGRIEWRRVAGGIVGGDVLGMRENRTCPILGSRVDATRSARGGTEECVRPYIHRDDPQIVVGGGGWVLVVIGRVTNLLPVRREGIVVLPAEGEDGSVVVARG